MIISPATMQLPVGPLSIPFKDDDIQTEVNHICRCLRGLKNFISLQM